MPLSNRNKEYVDPVCGRSVQTTSAAAQSCYNGIQLYFCSEGCRNQFDTEPEKFTVNQHKGFWRRYLQRLKKATGGRPPACH